jgi:hypothetical protein
MSRKLSGTVLCFLLSCPTIWAQKKSEYRAGHLLKIEVVAIPAEFEKTAHKADHLLYILEGSDEYVALYGVTYFGHDKSKLLKPDTDVSYRISGKSLFLKTPDGNEIKARLCERVGPGLVKCGNLTFAGMDSR